MPVQNDSLLGSEDCVQVLQRGASGRLMGLMPHPEAFMHFTNHPRWTREKLAEEGEGLILFRNALKYVRENLL